jgi:type II secretory pathway pseudopilin PulG
MQTRLWSLAVVALCAGVGCHKEAAGLGLPQAPSSTSELDALWAVGPSEPMIGVVLSPRGTGQLERAVQQIDAAMAASPDLAYLHQQVTAGVAQLTGGALQLASLGLASDQGAAYFMLSKREHAAVLPVANRDTLMAKLHGTKGKDEDQIAGTMCKPIGPHYVCVSDPGVFAKLGHGGVPAAVHAVGTRGDLELVVQHIPDAPELASVLQFEHGSVVMRGNVRQLPPEVAKYMGTPAAPPANAATAAGFGVIEFRPLLADMPAIPVVGGVTAADLAKSIAGPMTFTVPAGTTAFDAQVPLSDPTAMKTVIDQCANIPALQELQVIASPGACHIPVPQNSVTVDVRLDGKTLHFSTKGAGEPTTLAATGIGKLIGDGKWVFGTYGRGTVFTADLNAVQPMIALAGDAFRQVLRGMSVFSEGGFGVSKDGDTVHFVVGLRTIWSNPDDVVKQILAISPAQVIANQSTAAAEQIAAASPDSPFAQDLKAGVGGGYAFTPVVGILAAVAIPAFMDYTKRSKTTEAQLQLNKIGKAAKIGFAENSQFPVGEVGAEPTCCGQPNNHCAVNAATWQDPVWKALDFEIDEPHLYRYTYKSDGKTFHATAIGDLDCDGQEATYTLDGSVVDGAAQVQLTPPPPGAD